MDSVLDETKKIMEESYEIIKQIEVIEEDDNCCINCPSFFKNCISFKFL